MKHEIITELDVDTEFTQADQRTDAWFAARLGKVTASKAHDVLARTKSGYTAARANYMSQLLCERLTGLKEDGFKSAAMQWGIDNEALARSTYEALTGNAVCEVGFIDHPYIDMFGASPDGEIGREGLIEIKCPNTATHLDMMTSEVIPPKYLTQMMVQMACTGRLWCDFVSFDPRLPPEYSIWITRVQRDDDHIGEIEAEVEKFISELDEKIADLRARFIRNPYPANAG